MIKDKKLVSNTSEVIHLFTLRHLIISIDTQGAALKYGKIMYVLKLCIVVNLVFHGSVF